MFCYSKKKKASGDVKLSYQHFSSSVKQAVERTEINTVVNLWCDIYTRETTANVNMFVALKAFRATLFRNQCFSGSTGSWN